MLVLTLILAAVMTLPPGPTGGPTLVGKWDVTYTLAGQSRALRFEADASGKGSFLLRDSRSSLVEPAHPSVATWSQTDSGRVLLSGAVEFPIGNVGRDRGTLVFKGTFSGHDLIEGRVAFYPPGQDPSDPAAEPAKTGAFKAIRAATP